MQRWVQLIDRINIAIGKLSAFILLPLIAILIYEVFCRYLLNSPTKWSNEISQYLQVAVVMLGSAYCLAADDHVRMDVFYNNFSDRKRAVVELLSFFSVLVFASAIVWYGGELCYDALVHDKRTNTILELPLFPSMVLVPIGAFFLWLQSLSRGLRGLMTLIAPASSSGKDA